MKDNRNNKAKIYMIFSLVVLVIAVIVSGTYAYYVWTTSDSDTTKIVAGIGAATVTFDGGSDISANLRPVSDKSKGIVKNISVKADTEGLVFNMYLDITSIDTGLKDESFRYELYKGDTKVKEGNFSDSYLTSNTVTCTKNNTNHIVLLTNESISTSKTQYTLYIWIDGENYTNPNTMMNKTFSFKLHADGEGAVLAKTAAQTITELYMNAEKETVTNNGITYNYANIYDIDSDIDTSGGLMNDRLGGTTTSLDGGNIRYYGHNPNNYINFNCSDYSISTTYAWQFNTDNDGNQFTSEEECLNFIDTDYKNYVNSITCSSDWESMGFESETACNEFKTEEEIKEAVKYFQQDRCLEKFINQTDCELWRIIGVFDGKVKIIAINGNKTYYSYDSKDNSTETGNNVDLGKNDWTTARLMKLVNPSDYYEVDTNDNGLGQSLYWNSTSGKCYGYKGSKNAVDCDFTSTGIKNDITRSMIAETTYYLGGWDGNSMYPNQVYKYERGTEVYMGRPTIWKGKIALPYLSDFGYAVDLSQCKSTFNNYDSTTCNSNNWFSGIVFLTPVSNSCNKIWFANFSSEKEAFSDTYVASSTNMTNLTLYLNSDIKIIDGDGSSDNPYKLSV